MTSNEKVALRKKMLFLRKSLDATVVEERSAKIQKHLFSSNLFKQAKAVMVYLSYPKEVQTDTIVTEGLRLKKTVSVPICNTKEINLIPSKITDLNQVEVGFFNLREPKQQFISPIEAKLLDLVIIPGVAFDMDGNRIGHGKGYYDNFLHTLPASTPKIGLAFDYQITKSSWKIDDWDVKMDGIITESGWIIRDFIE